MPNPLVAVVMGSDSDWRVMQAAAVALTEFGIPYEVEVVSAHRTPEKMIAFGKAAAGRGLKAIIAGEGGAAHLPGMLAAVTTLPVIGCRCRCPPSTGWTRCCPSCRCPPGCRWPPSPSAALATLACSRCGWSPHPTPTSPSNSPTSRTGWRPSWRRRTRRCTGPCERIIPERINPVSASNPVRYPDVHEPAIMTKRAWWLVALNFLIPGSAQLLAGNRRLGRLGVRATAMY